VQATVESFEAESRSGTVVTDGGRVLNFGAETLADHIRHLRPGQRVHLTLEGEDITGVALWP
jgi:2-phospho-L-lactate guanylyltransferase